MLSHSDLQFSLAEDFYFLGQLNQIIEKHPVSYENILHLIKEVIPFYDLGADNLIYETLHQIINERKWLER